MDVQLSYGYSSLDRSLSEWFLNDALASSLRQIDVRRGTIRGLGPVELAFRYPITAIAGRNGTGKSTLLALAACAYHHTYLKFNPQRRRRPHYTFADFFMHVADEPEVAGVEVWYQFLHHSWKQKRGERPDPLGWQARIKQRGGRWSNYDSRVNRSVAFLGLQRVVPESEESVLRTYRAKFSLSQRDAWEQAVADSVGKVLGRTYSGLKFLRHATHRLPVLETPTYQYSGFNMGAGESALIELFATIYACADPLLVVIDEIELGLHEEAQYRLIAELKSIVKQRKLQVICSTHSGTVLAALPPEARIFIERSGSHVATLVGITPQYAAGRMSGSAQPELDVLVEDDHAVVILQAALPAHLRNRVRFIPVGSHTSVMRHLAMRATERVGLRPCAILDGDRRSLQAESVQNFLGGFEVRTPAADEARRAWLSTRLSHLPGDTWPERWSIDGLLSSAAAVLDADYGLEIGRRQALHEMACIAGKHNEFFALANALALPVDAIRPRLIACAFGDKPEERASIIAFVEAQLAVGPTWPG